MPELEPEGSDLLRLQPEENRDIRREEAELLRQEIQLVNKQTQIEEKVLAIQHAQLEIQQKLLKLEQGRYDMESVRRQEEQELRNADRAAAELQGRLALQNERIKTVFMPIAIVFLTAILGTGLGHYLQNRSFRHGELFKARLEQIVRQRAETVDLLRDVEEAWRQVRADEDFIVHEIDAAKSRGAAEVSRATNYYCSMVGKSIGFETLRKSRGRSGALADQARSFGVNNPASKSFTEFEVRLQAFLECADAKDCRRCTRDSNEVLQPLRDVIVAYGTLESRLISGEI